MAGKAVTLVTEGLKLFAACVAACGTLAAFVWWLVEPRVIEWVKVAVEIEAAGPFAGGPCANIPVTGHFIDGAGPGQWGSVEWRNVVRLRDNCGVPQVTGVVVNGGGFLHDSPLSIRGVPVAGGVHDFKYRFFIRDEVTPGKGQFRVIITYPDAVGGAPPAISPWLGFQIHDLP